MRLWPYLANCFFFSSRRRHTRWTGDWSSDVCSSDLRAFRHLPAERREVRNALASRAIRRHQLRHGTPPLRNHDLAPLPDLIQKRREVLAGLADSSRAHDASVLHVAHGVKRSLRASSYGRRSATRMPADGAESGVMVASAPSVSIAA